MSSDKLISDLERQIDTIKELVVSGKIKADQSSLIKLQSAIFAAIPLVNSLKEEIVKLTSTETNVGEKVGASFSLIGDLIQSIADEFPTKTKEEREAIKAERQEAKAEKKEERKKRKTKTNATDEESQN